MYGAAEISTFTFAVLAQSFVFYFSKTNLSFSKQSSTHENSSHQDNLLLHDKYSIRVNSLCKISSSILDDFALQDK